MRHLFLGGGIKLDMRHLHVYLRVAIYYIYGMCLQDKVCNIHVQMKMLFMLCTHMYVFINQSDHVIGEQKLIKNFPWVQDLTGCLYIAFQRQDSAVHILNLEHVAVYRPILLGMVSKFCGCQL